MLETSPSIWTVGHSNTDLGGFLALLDKHQIQSIADVRRFPVSRRHPHFALESLRDSLAGHQIEYQHFPDLGGRREPRADSINTNWKDPAFRGYADYMETADCREALDRLIRLAASKRTAVLCAEANWTHCHRSLLADYLKARGVVVHHILATGRVEEHPYTFAARIVRGQLTYTIESLFS